MFYLFSKIKKSWFLIKINTKKITRRLSVSFSKFYLSRRVRKTLKIVSIITLILVIGSFLSLFLYLKKLEKQLPSPDQLSKRKSTQSTIIYDKNGEELFRFFDDENREFVALDDVPDNVKWSILASEDADFYDHEGLDYKGILRCTGTSILKIVTLGKKGQFCGASTITQQLVRNTLMYDVFGQEAFERGNMLKTFRRKAREILLTIKVEEKYSKDEILQMYLNEVPLGGVNYGVQAASQSFYDKDLEDLNLSEAAVLAGLIRSPAKYNPIFGGKPEMAKLRQEYVFTQLLKNNEKFSLSLEEINAARDFELKYAFNQLDIKAPHFVFEVYNDLLTMYDEETLKTSGLKVTTTLNLNAQNKVKQLASEKISKYKKKYLAENVSVVVLDKNSDLVSLIGSANFFEEDNPRVTGNVNVAEQPRQMASSVKPFTYFTAIKQGYGMWALAPDIPMNLGYDVHNLNDEVAGLITSREALVKSINVSAMYMIELVGTSGFRGTLQELDVKVGSIAEDEYHATLGTKEITLMDLTKAYSVFSNEGVKRPIRRIIKIEDKDGKTIFENKIEKGERIYDREKVYQMNWALCDLGEFEDQLFADKGYFDIDGKRAICGKTGTSDGPRDTVAMLYHKNLTVGVWVGNSDSSKMYGALSGNTSLPIAHSIVSDLSEIYPSEMIEEPEGIIHGKVCKDTGAIMQNYNGTCELVDTIYTNQNKPKFDGREFVNICKVNGMKPKNKNQVLTFQYQTELELLETFLYFTYKIENKKHQKDYEKYLRLNNQNIIFDYPDEADCPIPEKIKDTYYIPGGTITYDDPTIWFGNPSYDTIIYPEIEDKLNIDIDIIGDPEYDKAKIYIDEILIEERNIDLEYSDLWNAHVYKYQYNYNLPENFALGQHVFKVEVIDTNSNKEIYSDKINFQADNFQQ